jgi:hypothetical protein
MPLLDFTQLSREQAEAFLDEYVATAPERLRMFLDEVVASGGPREE